MFSLLVHFEIGEIEVIVDISVSPFNVANMYIESLNTVYRELFCEIPWEQKFCTN